MNYLYAIPGAFLAPIIHEWVKAMCSARLGDPTPKSKGFLSGNPLKYFEPVGFFLMLAIGFGWGQPVPTSPLYYKDRRNGTLITYITPSAVNLLLGLAAAAVYRLMGSLPLTGGITDDIFKALFEIVRQFSILNIGLAVFNIVPIYPLDGAKVLQVFVTPQTTASMNRNEKVFQVVMLLFLFMGFPQQYIFYPIINAIFSIPFLF